ncbi:hypothetical protein [Neobacillus sp. D3-1R]|uniref:hypothetical protein n=1 Tax=Neobacillus sp. D3-1R TaxID=3445778 RepID=UPI003FA188EE
MQKHSTTSYLLAGAGIGIGTLVLLSTKSNRNKLVSAFYQFQEMMGLKEKNRFPIKKAGHPDPHDLEDNNMVSEGAMYSVQYYNENELIKNKE